MIISRNHTKADIASIVVLNNLCFDDKQRPDEALLLKHVHASEIWLAKEETELVGYALVDPGYDSAYLNQICVHPNFQRRGIGGNLLREVCLHYTFSKVLPKYRNVRLHCAMDNPAQRLYFNQGFRAFDIAYGFYKDGGNAIYMKKEL